MEIGEILAYTFNHHLYHSSCLNCMYVCMYVFTALNVCTVCVYVAATNPAAPASSTLPSTQQLVSFSALDTVSQDRTKTDSPAQKSKLKEEEKKRVSSLATAANNASASVPDVATFHS